MRMPRGRVLLIGLALSTAAAPAWASAPQQRFFSLVEDVGVVVEHRPTGPITALRFSPDGRFLAVGGYEQVLLWDLAEARLVRRIGHDVLDGPVHALAFVEDSHLLAVGDGRPHASARVRLFDRESGELTDTLEGPADALYAMDASRRLGGEDGEDGEDGAGILAAGGGDGRVFLWSVDGEQREPIGVLDGHASRITGVRFSDNGSRLVTASFDGAVHVWQMPEGTRSRSMHEPDAVHDVAIAADNRTTAAAISGLRRWAVHLRDPQRRRGRPDALRPQAAPICVVWARGDRHVAVGWDDHVVRAYNAGNRRQLRAFQGHDGPVTGISLSGDDRLLASADAQGVVKLWDFAGGERLATLILLDHTTDDRWLIASAVGYLALGSAEIVRWRDEADRSPDDLAERLIAPQRVAETIAGNQDVPAPSLDTESDP